MAARVKTGSDGKPQVANSVITMGWKGGKDHALRPTCTTFLAH